jgi:SAM-dependent methyltransferase
MSMVHFNGSYNKGPFYDAYRHSPPRPPNRYQSPESYDDPAGFWRGIGKEYYKLLDLDGPAYQLQESAFMRILNRYFHYTLKDTDGPRFVLELGAGFGRMTKRIIEDFENSISVYYAIDCSQDQINLMLKDYLPARFNQVVAITLDILSPQYDIELRPLINQVDLVVCSEFLMHVPPSDLDWVMNRAIDTLKPKGAMINVDWTLAGKNKEKLIDGYHAVPECFLYDYELRYENNSRIEHIDVKHLPEINQSIFLAY